MGSPGLDNLRWIRPVRPGDTLKVQAKVREKRPSSSKPDRGTLIMDYAVKNQVDEPVMTFTEIHLLARKPTCSGRALPFRVRSCSAGNLALSPTDFKPTAAVLRTGRTSESHLTIPT